MAKDIEKILNGCFHPKEGRPNLRKVPVSAERARQHIDKAHKDLRAMEAMFTNDLFDWTVICGYYAMYHAVLSALFAIGIRAVAHYCAIAAFIRNSMLPKRRLALSMLPTLTGLNSLNRSMPILWKRRRQTGW